MFSGFDPFRVLDLFSRELFPSTAIASGWMPMDLLRTDDQVQLTFDLPGIDPASVDVSIEGNTLTVKAERHEQQTDGLKTLVKERPTGTFIRQVLLNEKVDLDQVTASYAHGVLTVTLPLAESVKPRRIEITAGKQAAIAAPEREPVAA